MLSGGQSKPVFKNEDMNPINIIKNSYNEGACPDCVEDIPDDVSNGDACLDCGHVFHTSVDDADEKTEEVCDECGSVNIGYDAWVKKIDGKVEIVGGPFDRCICLTDSCSRYENETVGRLVLVQNLRYCNGQDCDYQGDKDVMTSKPMPQWKGKNPVTKPEGYEYWYCSNCVVENWSRAIERIEESE